MARIHEPTRGELLLRQEHADLISQGYEFYFGCHVNVVPELVAACNRRGFEAIVGEKMFSADGTSNSEQRAIFAKEKILQLSYRGKSTA